MSRLEVVRCDLLSCAKQEPNGTDGWGTAHFAGRLYDFCSSEHQAAWEAEIVELDNLPPPEEEAEPVPFVPPAQPEPVLEREPPPEQYPPPEGRKAPTLRKPRPPRKTRKKKADWMGP